MNKTLLVEGMMCPRCEARVKKALEALDGVELATPDRAANCVTVTVTPASPVSDEVLMQTVTEAGYTVRGMAD